MVPQAEKLLERAQKGERLNTKDRRHCLAYLDVAKPDYTNVALAELFKVTERMIRVDRDKIRKQKAEIVKKEDIGLVIADIALCFDRQVRDLEHSKAKCKVGSAVYLNHCKAIFNLQLEKVRALQELGFYPKNLGNMTVDKFEYKAVMLADGSITTRPVNMQFDDAIDVDTVQQVIEPPAQQESDSQLEIDLAAIEEEMTQQVSP